MEKEEEEEEETIRTKPKWNKFEIRVIPVQRGSWVQVLATERKESLLDEKSNCFLF